MGMLDEESPRGSVTDVPLGKVRNMFTSLHPGSTIIDTESHQATCVIKSGFDGVLFVIFMAECQIVGEC